ncbi:UDP-3-O-(3-hydroxymyristoyl) glucosamine N-acyltransferase [Thalassoporum mexicanum PCC 7367]|uniref:UDP-3-O-(3-hydroxymyristoyl)glucosamine N-acyltransferase n=1 Tax=Thalassoporum mexicanum TaxID=3457544 RepID=UPI00029FE4EB|nr:UDP-3-O-(3-hydroxymyristoyl)glucosamine N-acyltransferase [Pseudanabaena sp. PCC 7367]AFY69789.1 UDP-3-O-(3-hydroxymyristoyl) glucosamine N-acyltransferase [Pseudanabaena sp. PCC 7367]
MKFSQLLNQLDVSKSAAKIELGSDPDITGLSTLESAQVEQLAFFENIRFFSQLSQTQAGAVLVPDNAEAIALMQSRQIPFAAVAQPRLLFAQALNIFYQPYQPPAGIDPSASIAANVAIGTDVYIGPNVVVHPNVQIGAGVYLHANVVIYAGVTIGDRTVIHANTVIHERSVIGNDCLIHSGAAIGSEGFGFVPTAQGTWTKMPQAGRTVLADRVEVGCNAAIDRGAIGDTYIGTGTKIDNLVQIGHGCTMGNDCLLAGQAGLAGGVKLGKNVILAGQVGVTNHLQIGDRVIAGAQAGIAQNVPAGSQIQGTPAFSQKVWLKASALFRRWPEIYKMIKQIQRDLEEIKARPK